MILLRTLLNLRNAKLSIKYHLVLFSLQGILFFATTMEGSPVRPDRRAESHGNASDAQCWGGTFTTRGLDQFLGFIYF